jgi:hypothetical protein
MVGCRHLRLRIQPSLADTAVGSLASFWSPDVTLLTFEFFIEVAATEIELHRGKR